MRLLLLVCCAVAAASAQTTIGVTGVITGANHEPVQGRVTAVTAAASVSFYNTLSDEQGRFAIDLPPGTSTLRAAAEGYASSELTLALVPGRVYPAVRFSLTYAGSVSGTVVDLTGAFVPGARVWLSYRGERGGWRSSDETGGEETDQAGRFTISVVAQGRPFLLHVEKEGWLLSSSTTMTLRTPELSRRRPSAWWERGSVVRANYGRLRPARDGSHRPLARNPEQFRLFR